MNQTRNFLWATLACCMVVTMATNACAQGQRGRGAREASVTSAQQGRGAPADSGQSPARFALDFQDQDLQVVLNALAEAGNLNVTMTNVPPQKVTVRMARGVPRDTLVAIIRTLAEAGGMKVTVQGGLLRLEGDPELMPARQQTLQQQRAQQQQQAAVELKLFTYRLKHANASTVAPILMNLLGNASGAALPGVTILQGGRGGNIGFGTTGTGAAGGRGGRGAGGTGAAQPSEAAAEVAIAQGAAAARGGRGGRGVQGALQGLFGNLLSQQAEAIGTLSNSSAQVRIVAEESTNSLLIRATETDYQLLQGIVQAIDLRPLQVLIEVTIAEVQRSNDLDVGLGGTATRKGATPGAPRDTVALLPGNASARDFIFALTGGNGSINYNAAINALQTRGDVKVLSLPVIIAQNNKEATLNVGEQRPFVQVNQSVTTGSVPTTVQTIQYINVGTTLTITPTINPDGYVNMAVSQTNNAATNEVQFNAPVISQREANTQIFLRDGQTTVIGGLAGNTTTKTTSGLPWFSRIPFIGGLLFGNTSQTQVTNELFLFLTPHIISSDEDIEKFRNSLKSGTDLLKDVPLGPRISPEDSLKVRVPPDTTRRRPPPDTGRRRPPLGV